MNVDHGKAAAGLSIIAVGAAIALWYANSHGRTDGAYLTAACLFGLSLLVGGYLVVAHS